MNPISDTNPLKNNKKQKTIKKQKNCVCYNDKQLNIPSSGIRDGTYPVDCGGTAEGVEAADGEDTLEDKSCFCKFFD